jgi:serine/threonine-protein kinase
MCAVRRASLSYTPRELSGAALKRAIWNTDWLMGVAFCAAFMLAAFGMRLFYGLETAVYDRYMQLSYRQPAADVTVIAIDDRSIDSIGRWPWTRDILASVIDRLRAGGARLVASTVFMSEPEIDAGLDSLRQIDAFYRDSALARDTASDSPLAADLAALGERLDRAVADLDYDARLAESLARAGNVLLPIDITLGRPLGPAPEALAPFVVANTLAFPDRDATELEARRLVAPIPVLGERARGLGHLSLALDADGSVRFEPLLVRHQDREVPSLALAIVAQALQLPLSAIERAPDGLRLGRLAISTTPDLRMYSYYYAERSGAPAFPVDSFYDVFSERLPADKYRGKIVLIGASAAGIGDRVRTPVAAAMPPVLVLAHTVSSLLEEHFYVRPPWARAFELGVVVLLTLYLALALPRLRATTAALLSLALVVTLLGAELVAMSRWSLWLQLAVPALLVASGHLVMTVKRFGVTELLKQRADFESSESNRMLGLAFQSQGQLDLAFEKLRRCPLDAPMLDLLYNLGLDYESKRQLGKAGAVYRYMADFDSSYRDLTQRIERTRDLSDTLAPRAPNPGDTLVVAGVAKPKLGRYILEREVGHGAMGTVYQGRDPTINRIVAIKTIALCAEFDADEVAAARERFFREAESAGRLNHPDIVTVYDAGEEHDVAYIAMEFLTGTHLNPHTRPGQLLRAQQVVALGARVADALQYAHDQRVVHRDIKPTNVMYNPGTGDIKITDFGIARITDSSRTRTGTVLGTPSYMAPEQLSGKNVTGRSDIYSLGVTLYQLLTGALPFRADSMAALMYRIANGVYEPLVVLRPDLPDCVGQTLDRALATDPERRYRTGGELAKALRRCGTHLTGSDVTEQTGHAA